MEKQRQEKVDRTSNLKGQISRIYMNTIAANEREDKLLNQKLDAIDLEHRTQYMRMKKIIRDARSFSSKRFQLLAAERQRSWEDKKCHTALGSCDGNRRISDTINDQNCFDIEELSRRGNESGEGVKGKPRLFQMESECHDELVDRLQYTENEVSRMRKSWVGQNASPQRKRAFLPHLDTQPDIKPLTIKGGNSGSNQRMTHRASCYPQLLNGKQKEENLPVICASSLPKSLERRLTLDGNTTTALRAMKRESTALSKSFSSNF